MREYVRYGMKIKWILCTVFIYSKWQIWFPFTFQFYMYINGCQVGFYRGDVKLLMDDIGALKPTVFPTVPRLLNRVYDKVHQFFSHDHIENKSDKNKRFSG